MAPQPECVEGSGLSFSSEAPRRGETRSSPRWENDKDMQQKALFADAFLIQPSIIRRLIAGFTDASREFRQDPRAYVAGAIKGDGVGGRVRQDRLMLGFAVAICVFTLFMGAMLLAFWLKHRSDGAQ